MSICFTQTIRHGGDHLHSDPPPPHRRPLHPQGLYIGTFNIHIGQGFRIMQDIQVVQIGGFDLIVLTETKVTNQDYCHNRLGYNMVC